MKTLKYYKNKLKFAKTDTGKDSAKRNAETNLSEKDYKFFLEYVATLEKN